jgi:cation diffusion facilitator CzcD-associated flavoprotein CzcO
MPHELTDLKVNTVRKPPGDPTEQLTADICVVGAGISGLSAAVEARGLGPAGTCFRGRSAC